MLIGKLSKATGLSKDGIRYYEQLGLIHSTPLAAGTRTYRDYHQDSLKRIELIECGKAAGFSLKEIQPLLASFLHGELDLKQQNELLQSKLVELTKRERAIKQMRATIESVLSQSSV